jgi:hypothetical protein
MALDVRIENEKGQVVRHLGVVTALDRLWTADQIARFPWLTSIDPYGDTTLNRLQVEHVHHELAELVEALDYPNDREDLKTLMRWIEELPDAHLYLKLAGE